MTENTVCNKNEDATLHSAAIIDIKIMGLSLCPSLRCVYCFVLIAIFTIVRRLVRLVKKTSDSMRRQFSIVIQFKRTVIPATLNVS